MCNKKKKKILKKSRYGTVVRAKYQLNDVIDSSQFSN